MPPNPTPAERCATILQWLIKAVAARSNWRRPDQLPGPLTMLICTRLAAQIQAGTYRPRRFAPRRPSIVRRPRPPSLLPHRAGWLVRLVQETAGPRGWLETLLQDPEMIALLQAAPAMARPVRSLCWMLLLPPPPILAPRRAAPKAAPAAPAAPSAREPLASSRVWRGPPGLAKRVCFGHSRRMPPSRQTGVATR